MAMSPNINDREMQKFREGANPGETEVAVTGNINTVQAGLSQAGLFTEVTIDNTTWTQLPATALTNRNTLRIYNASNQKIYYNFQPSDLPTLIGWPIPVGGVEDYTITDDIPVYAKSSTSSVIILVGELA